MRATVQTIAVTAAIVGLTLSLTSCASDEPDQSTRTTSTTIPTPPPKPGATTTTPTPSPPPAVALNYDQLEQKPGRFVATATLGLHVGGIGQDNVDRFLRTPAAGTMPAGSQWSGLPYYRIAAYDEVKVEVEATDDPTRLRIIKGSATKAEPMDEVRGESIAKGTTLKDISGDVLVLSSPSSVEDTETVTIRWPAIMESRIGYEGEAVARLTNQGDPAVNGTFEIFANTYGVDGVYAVRTLWWNGLHNDSIESLALNLPLRSPLAAPASTPRSSG